MPDRIGHGTNGFAAATLTASSPRRRVFSLVVHDKEIFLRAGTHVVGRALTCDIVLNDRLVSREHAELLVGDTSVILRDLGSINGVFVNESRVDGELEIRDNDLIIIGAQELTLRAVVSDDERATSPGKALVSEEGEVSKVIEREAPRGERAASPSPDELELVIPAGDTEPSAVVRAPIGSIRAPDSRADDGPNVTEKADTFLVIGRLADRAMVMGNYEAAEHVLDNHLTALLVGARNDMRIPDSVLEAATRYALRLADATRKARWVDVAVELQLLARHPMSDWSTARLLSIMSCPPDIDRELFFFYQHMLRTSMDSFTPAERALAQQIVDLKLGG